MQLVRLLWLLFYLSAPPSFVSAEENLIVVIETKPQLILSARMPMNELIWSAISDF
jgi:hypothetical protein